MKTKILNLPNNHWESIIQVVEFILIGQSDYEFHAMIWLFGIGVLILFDYGKQTVVDGVFIFVAVECQLETFQL